MPPKLMAPERRAGRARGKSDPIDALAVARAALREPDLSRPRAGRGAVPRAEAAGRSPRRRSSTSAGGPSSGCAGTCTSSTRPSWCRCGCSTAPSHLERVGRWLARREQELQVRLARELVARCRSLNREIAELDRELEQRTSGDRAGAARAARLRRRSPPRSCSPRSARSAASKATRSSPATAASHRWKRAQAGSNATDSTAAATANSTPPSTGSRSPRPATTPPHAPTSNANEPKAKAAAKPSAASNDSSSASSSTPSKRAPP